MRAKLDRATADRQDARAFLFELRFRADLEGLKTVRGHVRAVARQCGFDDPVAQDIVLAVDEANKNILRHAYGAPAAGDIVLRLFRCRSDLLVELRDFAPVVDPACIRPREPKELRPGQLGTRLIHTIMDRVELAPAPDGAGHLLRLFKRLE